MNDDDDTVIDNRTTTESPQAMEGDDYDLGGLLKTTTESSEVGADYMNGNDYLAIQYSQGSDYNNVPKVPIVPEEIGFKHTSESGSDYHLVLGGRRGRPLRRYSHHWNRGPDLKHASESGSD